MTDPLFWLGLSFLLVCISLILVLLAALPALQAVARAARSVEKLADTLTREFPPTLQAIRLTGMEISDLTDDVNEGVQTAGQVVKQVDESISSVKNQAKKAQITTSSIITGIKTAWKTFSRHKPNSPSSSSVSRRTVERLPPSQKKPLDLRDRSSTPPFTYRSQDDDPYDSDLPPPSSSKVNREQESDRTYGQNTSSASHRQEPLEDFREDF